MIGDSVIGSARKIIASNSKHGTECFLENYRNFCCLNFENVLSLLYTPSRLRMGLIWLRNVSLLVSANDRS